jgi:multiple sugar transport system ATP-binding protein
LRLVAGLEKPDRGTIQIAGRDATALEPAARDVAFVFQQYSLYPHLSVFDNLAFPLRSPARRMSADEVRRRVEEVARLVRIDHKLENRSTRLSGGEMQRVAIGRALVRKPAIFLMDEPLSSLDAKLRAELRLELKRIQTELGATVLYVTHDQIEAMTMADRIGILAEGVLVQIGTPKAIYTEPANLHVAARLGQPAINLLPLGLLPESAAPAGTRTIGARTEHLTIEKSANGHADGTVAWIEHLGDQNHLHVTVGDRKLITLTDPDTPLRKGDGVTIRLRNPLFFDSAGNRI